MKVLGFKKWYEKKEMQVTRIKIGSPVEKMSSNIFKAPSKMLHIEIGILDECVNVNKSKNLIERYYMSLDTDVYDDTDLNFLKKKISEAKKTKNKIYLLGYDFKSTDARKCYKNSQISLNKLKNSIQDLQEIPHRSFGSFEQVSESHQQHVIPSLIKERAELIICHFDPDEIGGSIEIPFHFNPNDSFLLEKYQTCLRGIITQFILKNEVLEMKISASKPWPISKQKKLNESDLDSENLSEIFEMKYSHPGKTSLNNPNNKPIQTTNKITILELTEKRANSVSKYLSGLTKGMPIKFVCEGLGYKEGNPSLKISIK